MFGSLKKKDQEDQNESTLMQELEGTVDKDLRLDYIITGGWLHEASTETARLFSPEHVNIVADSRQINYGKLSKIPEEGI